MDRIDALKAEVAATPQILRAAAQRWQASAQALRDARETRRTIALLGRGRSGNACAFAAYQIALSLGRQPIEFRPWLASQAVGRADSWDDVEVWAYSLTGETTEVVQAATWLRERGARVVAITDHADSALAEVAQHALALELQPHGGEMETAGLCGLLFATGALLGENLAAVVGDTARCMDELLDRGLGGQLADFLASGELSWWVARGPTQCAALEAALTQQQVVTRPALGLSTAELLHGPLPALGATHRVIFLLDAPRGDYQAAATRLLTQGTPYLAVVPRRESAAPRSAAEVEIALPRQASGRTALLVLVGHLVASAWAAHER